MAMDAVVELRSLSAKPSNAHCSRRAASSADWALKNRDGSTTPCAASGEPPEAVRMSTARAAARDSEGHETAAGEPLLSDVRSHNERTTPRGAAGCPFTPAVSVADAEGSESAGPDTRSCRMLAILFTSRPFSLDPPQSKNDCASPEEVVVYQPERTAVNPLDHYGYRTCNGHVHLTRGSRQNCPA